MNKIGRSIKSGIGMMKYSMAFKMNVVLMIAFAALGIAYEVITVFSMLRGEHSQGISNYNGIWMLAISPIYSIQLMYGISLAGIVQSSSAKKGLLVYAATAFKAVMEIVCYTILAVTRYFCCQITGEARPDILFGLLFFGLFSLVISLYTVIIYRYVTAGYVIMLPLIIIFMLVPVFTSRKEILFNPSVLMGMMPFGHSYAACVIIGAAIVILDIVLFFVLSKLLYKVPLAERAFKQLLARAK